MYADYEFYTTEYFGSKISEEDWPKYGSKASDFMDFATCQNLVDNLPTDPAMETKIKKATCSVADAMKDIDSRRAMTGGAGATSGVIQSIASGGEKITYVTSRLDEVITAGENSTRNYLYQAMYQYMSGVTDDAGNLYLYEGIQ